ncbi:AMP-binding protein [Desulfatiglans anilini]|uniref:AMP-binding protein n=1 Tax=Desulfatiglans anilini TaxID=90728 RepID=UPI00040E125D|nr:AMP-binding protein [Desulfatiglans anilini]
MRASRFTDGLIREYTEKGYWQPITYADLYDQNAKKYFDKIAFVDDSGNKFTFKEANDAINKLAIKLVELGFQKDDVLVVQLPNRVELVLLLVACEKAGIISSTVVRTLRDQEIEYLLRVTGAKGYVCMPEFRSFNYLDMIANMRSRLPNLSSIFTCGDDAIDDTINVKSIITAEIDDSLIDQKIAIIRENQIRFDEVAWLGFTTGTTGFPKLVETPMSLATTVAPSHMGKIKMTHDDVVGALCPVSGAARGLLRFNPFVGAKGVLMEHFDAEKAFHLIEKEKISIPMMVPAQLAMMSQNPNYTKYDLTSLRVFQVSGAPLPPHVANDVEKKFNCMVINHYGGMDAGSVASVDADDQLEVRRFSVGKPHPGNEVLLLDDNGNVVSIGEVGAVHFRGPTSVGGYYKDPAMTQEAWGSGYFNMGDLAKKDEEGNIYIVGRKKDCIIRGGYNIYPTEVESILITNPKIEAAAVIGYPDNIMGEKACAYVVVKKGETFSFAEMQEFFRSKQLSANKTPERLEIIDEMPLVSDMKLDKKVLKNDLLRKLESESHI